MAPNPPSPEPAPGPPRPWDHQPNETQAAFAAFAIYRNLGSERSIAKAGEEFGKRPGKVRQMEKWSSRWRWVERVAAWDAHMDALTVQELERAIPKMRAQDAKEARAIKAVLLQGITTLGQRLQHLDEQDREELMRSLPIAEHVKLAALLARTMRVPTIIEWAARGYKPGVQLAEGADEEDDDLDKIIADVREAWDQTPKPKKEARP